MPVHIELERIARMQLCIGTLAPLILGPMMKPYRILVQQYLRDTVVGMAEDPPRGGPQYSPSEVKLSGMRRSHQG